MSISGVNRYRDLVDAVIDGKYYKGSGTILPYKSLPTSLRLETASPSTKFGTYLNEIFMGEVISDSQGNVVFTQILPLGEIEVSIVNSVTGQRFITYVTVRDWALWLASYAESLETIDDNIQETQDDLAIETVTINGIEDHFGKAIDVYNELGQSLDVYRWMTHELRLAYRNTGARYNGLEVGVAAFTQVPPFGYQRRFWGPNWYLDQSMLVNHRFLERSHAVYDAVAPVNVTGVTLTEVEVDVDSNPGVPHELSYNATSKMLLWTPNGGAGTPVLAVNGLVFLPGPPSLRPAFILGRDVSVTPYSVVAGASDSLYLNVNDIGSITVPLTPGPSTPAQVVVDIDAAFAADLRPAYVALSGAFAFVYNAKLLLICPVATGSSIRIEHGVNNGAAEILGSDPSDLLYDPHPIAGVDIVALHGLMHTVGANYVLDYAYTAGIPPVRTLRWRPNFSGAWSAVSSITETGTYNIVHPTGTSMEVYCYFDEMPTVGSSTFFSVGFQKYVENTPQTQGLWVQVDKTLLPAVNATDVVKVYDDIDDGFIETPDNWTIASLTGSELSWFEPSDVICCKEDRMSAAPAFQWRITDATASTIQLVGRVHRLPVVWPGVKGQNYPQRNRGMFYDYEGFTAQFGVWLRNLNSADATATLSFSFDDGGTWVSSVAQAITTDTIGLGLEDPSYVSFDTVIPAEVTANGVFVRIQIDVPLGTVDVAVDSPSVGVKYITSRNLNYATVSRWRHHQYFGELMWCWSPDALSLKEKQYIGLEHKAADRTTVYAGVAITDISPDTVAGLGSLDYEYNSIPDTRRLRWNSYGNTWGAGLGWVTVVSSGSYTLQAPDGSFLTVTVGYDALQVLAGTPPAASVSRPVTVSDDTTTQGTVRKIAAAQSAIEIFDTSEYVGGAAINLKGCVAEGDFIMSGAINLSLAMADPFRYAYLYPSDGPVTGEALTVSVGAPHLATLDYNSDQDQTNAVLYQDGLPVSNDSWAFTASNQIRILTTGLSPYSASSVYTIDYGLLYQFVTPYLDLGAGGYLNYAWYADYYLWDRMDSVEGQYETTTPVIFNLNTGRAYLSQKSTGESGLAKLFVQNGTEYIEIPKQYWKFRDSLTVELEPAYLIENAQYYLQHEEARVYEESNLTVTFEHRSGTDSAACSVAAWTTVDRNENVTVYNGHVVHQLRLSVSGIRDIRDFRIRSLVLKGLKIHGASPDVNGLTNIWGA